MKSIFVFSLLFFSSLTVSAQTYRELSEKAIDCIERDSLAQAEDLLVQAMKLEPSNPHNALLFSNLGLVQRRLGRYDDALQSYTYALNIYLIGSCCYLYGERNDRSCFSGLFRSARVR